ncbi:MAG: hypothetical protein KF861_10590, partial [Planctomycetaceae bacterium]|nr:hypothetical protein [Planctomycetaceae bacterium]
MKRSVLAVLAIGIFSGRVLAQEFVVGGPTPGGEEPLYSYDDREVWKHGWIQVIPFYGGYHSYRPYNYKQVFAQAAQSEAWGMPRTMPYSQQYYHRYQHLG